MSNSSVLTRDFRGATLSIPADNLFDAWLRQQIGSPPPTSIVVPHIGTGWPGQGGIYAGVIRGDERDYHLIVPKAIASSDDTFEWGAYGVDEPGAKSERDGAANTAALLASSNDHPAAKFAAELEIDGHSDFYLPSRRELALLYANVPELFQKAYYWSSTQYSSNIAWFQDFSDGSQYDASKALSSVSQPSAD